MLSQPYFFEYKNIYFFPLKLIANDDIKLWKSRKQSYFELLPEYGKVNSRHYLFWQQVTSSGIASAVGSKRNFIFAYSYTMRS